MLERLCLLPPDGVRRHPNDLSFLTVSAFPALRHLDFRDTFDLMGIPHQIPTLHTLIIKVQSGQGLPEILSACSPSLKSLVITITSFDTPPGAFDVDLPNLTYFKVEDRYGDEYGEDYQLLAPNLTTYLEEQTYLGPSVFLCNTLDSAKHARFSRMPHFKEPTRLRILQLKLLFSDHGRSLDTFAKSDAFFPHLEVLEFLQSWMNSSQVGEIRRILKAWDWTVFKYMVYPPRLIKEWTVDLTEENAPAECGNNLPCTRWGLTTPTL
ncbi:hypothetical protein M408DRAFT_330215, partial [Serendipita vermifera MAFF 305830]